MEGRSNGKTLNLFLLSRRIFINIAPLTRARVQCRKGAVETKMSRIEDDEQ